MFRLWYLTFSGAPRDAHIYQHAHESPKVMSVPLVVLAFLAATVAWKAPGTDWSLRTLLEQACPPGVEKGLSQGWYRPAVTLPSEKSAHEHHTAVIVEWSAFLAALIGFLAATLIYGMRKIDPAIIQRYFAPLYSLFRHKWWFDELYGLLFVRPVLKLSSLAAAIDRHVWDRLADGSARAVAALARFDDYFDRFLVDEAVNLLAQWTQASAYRLRRLQTGNLHSYILWLAAGLIGLFVLLTLYWNYTMAGT